MRPGNKERLRRVLLAAVLKSDLSLNEMQDLADEMSASPDFVWEFSSLLRDIIDRLRTTGPRKQSSQKPDASTVLEAAYRAIQRRRLSKKEVLETMAKVSPGTEWRSRFTLPVREILAYFFSVASPSELARFLERFDVNPDFQDLRQDAYLRGIDRK